MQMSENKKIFQPKVIIGSILGFVSAAVGIVAVFFPSLLNLERERMPKYDGGEQWSSVEAEVENYNKFIKFLDDRIKDEKLFEVRLNLPLGGDGWNSEYIEGFLKKGITFSEDDGNVCIVVTGGRWDAATGANTGDVEGFGVEISADDVPLSNTGVFGADTSSFCFPVGMVSAETQLNGYAYYNDVYGRGATTYWFKAVDKSAVKLKKY